MPIIFYLLLDHVIRSSAINLHLAFNLGFAHHRCQVSVQRCVWPPAMTLGVIQTNHGRAMNEPASAPLTVWLPLSPLSCRHTCPGTHQQRRPAISLANFLSRFK